MAAWSLPRVTTWWRHKNRQGRATTLHISVLKNQHFIVPEVQAWVGENIPNIRLEHNFRYAWFSYMEKNRSLPGDKWKVLPRSWWMRPWWLAGIQVSSGTCPGVTASTAIITAICRQVRAMMKEQGERKGTKKLNKKTATLATKNRNSSKSWNCPAPNFFAAENLLKKCWTQSVSVSVSKWAKPYQKNMTEQGNSALQTYEQSLQPYSDSVIQTSPPNKETSPHSNEHDTSMQALKEDLSHKSTSE